MQLVTKRYILLPGVLFVFANPDGIITIKDDFETNATG